MALLSWEACLPILYAGVLSCGVGYTLQIIGRRDESDGCRSDLESGGSIFCTVWMADPKTTSGYQRAGGMWTDLLCDHTGTDPNWKTKV